MRTVLASTQGHAGIVGDEVEGVVRGKVVGRRWHFVTVWVPEPLGIRGLPYPKVGMLPVGHCEVELEEGSGKLTMTVCSDRVQTGFRPGKYPP